MKATKKSISFGAVIFLIVACIVFYFLPWEPRGFLQVSPADIPPPVVVQLTQSNAPLRVFPGVGGLFLILPDGSLWKWGQTGPGSWTRAKVPTQVGTNLDWKQAFAANNHSVAIRTNGTLWEWGSMGPAGQAFSNDPEKVDPGHDWVEVSAGDLHSIALRSDGTLWTWGDNSTFQLGIGSGPTRTNLVQIGTNQDWTGILGLGSHTLGVRKDGTLWVWGQVYWFPKIRAGKNFMVPTQVSSDTNWIGVNLQGALLRRQTVEYWNPLFSPPNAGAAISTNNLLMVSNWISNRSALAYVGLLAQYEVRADGTLWKSPFSLSSEGPKPSNKWRQVGKRSDWISIWGFGTVVGLTSDGTVWMWGADPGQEPVPDMRSRLTLLEADVMTRLGNPPKSMSTQANSRYQKEPRPLMRLVPANNLQTNSATVPAK